MTVLDRDSTRPAWWGSAACAGLTSIMFSESAAGQARAVEVCMSCPVRRQCLEEARAIERTAYHTIGVRGGLTPDQRSGTR
jgi:hypothetical protein